MRVHIPANTLYTYPDFFVICGENEFSGKKKDTILNPSVIVEVLSPTTSSYDRGQKFHLYRSIPTLMEYASIDSLSLSAEVYRKNEEGVWYLASEGYDQNDSISFNTVDVTLKISEIYAGTEDLLPLD